MSQSEFRRFDPALAPKWNSLEKVAAASLPVMNVAAAKPTLSNEQAVSALRFSQVSEEFMTDTPEGRLAFRQMQQIRQTLERLRSDAEMSSAVLSLRQVGWRSWLEARTESKIERLLLDGKADRFSAYEVQAGGKTFLIPAEDVLAVFSEIPEGAEGYFLSKIVGFHQKSESVSSLERAAHAQGPLRTHRALLVRFRGTSRIVAVDSFSSPNQYSLQDAESALEAFLEKKPIPGFSAVVRTHDQKRAVVLDLYVLLERAGNPSLLRPKKDELPSRYLVFRVSGRRYALPLALVQSVGRLDNGMLIQSKVTTPQGSVRLFDMKHVLRTQGECGGMFIIVKNMGWAVDGVETEIPLKGELSNVPSVSGQRKPVIALIKDGHPGAPIHVLDPEFFAKKPARGEFLSSVSA